MYPVIGFYFTLAFFQLKSCCIARFCCSLESLLTLCWEKAFLSFVWVSLKRLFWTRSEVPCRECCFEASQHVVSPSQSTSQTTAFRFSHFSLMCLLNWGAGGFFSGRRNAICRVIYYSFVVLWKKFLGHLKVCFSQTQKEKPCIGVSVIALWGEVLGRDWGMFIL